MIRLLIERISGLRGPCRAGHLWTELARPPACSRCGRSRPMAFDR